MKKKLSGEVYKISTGIVFVALICSAAIHIIKNGTHYKSRLTELCNDLTLCYKSKEPTSSHGASSASETPSSFTGTAAATVPASATAPTILDTLYISSTEATAPQTSIPEATASPIATAAAFDGLNYNIIGSRSKKGLYYYVMTDSNNNITYISPAHKSTLEKYNTVLQGRTDEKKVYLTFNLGFEAGYTDKTLQILKKKNIKATFFCLGEYVWNSPEFVKKIYSQGHLLANHGDRHIMMPEKSIEKAANNITDFEKSLKKYTGLEVNVKYFRPPSGYYSERDLEIADQLGKISVFWGFAYMDYEDKSKYSSDEVYHMLCDNLKNGQIYQLHLRNPANTDALEKFIDEAKSRGYSFGLISDIA